MKRKRKTFIGGNLVKIIEYTPQFPNDAPQIRSEKRKVSRLAQKAQNCKNAQTRLELKLAANFSNRDYFITCTYRKGEEPTTRSQAKKHKAQYLRRLREIRSRRGQPLKWICCIECKHGEGRYHLHAVINSIGFKADREEIESLWDCGHVHIDRLFDAKHDNGEQFNSWLQIAKYMTKERPEDGHDDTPNGWQIYSCSRNLDKPIELPSEWVDEAGPIKLPAGAVLIASECTITENRYGEYQYIKYMTEPLKPF